jgi:hypothetical protein
MALLSFSSRSNKGLKPRPRGPGAARRRSAGGSFTFLARRVKAPLRGGDNLRPCVFGAPGIERRPFPRPEDRLRGRGYQADTRDLRRNAETIRWSPVAGAAAYVDPQVLQSMQAAGEGLEQMYE